MKNLISKSLLMAAVVGAAFTSCEKEPTVSGVVGEKTNIALGMSVALPVQTKAATTVGDINFGTGIADIANVTIVPMVGTAVQNPIVLGTFDADVNTTHYRKATVLQSVDGFRVYGNLPSAASETAVFVMPPLAKGDNADNKDAALSNVKEPHSLYYYAEANTSTNKFKVAKGDNWESPTSPWTDATEAIGENNLIKIPGVTYAVGVFSAAVHDAVADVEGNNALTKNIFSEDGATPTQSWNDLKAGNGIKVTGIVIDGQTADFDAAFKAKGAEVKVFAAAGTQDLATADIEFDGANKVAGANIYSVVAPETDESIVVNFQFQNNTGKKLHLNSGDVVDNGGYFYLPAILKKGASQNIFEAATSTLINARVKDWGKGITTPAETTDVQIGIEISTEWKKGIAFDVEI